MLARDLTRFILAQLTVTDCSSLLTFSLSLDVAYNLAIFPKHLIDI